MQIRPSAEDYLETILLLSKKKGAVRSVDIGDEMGFSRPSVSVALKKLREDGLAAMDADGFITLTEKGEAAAAQVYDRHSTLFDWLLALGVSETVLCPHCPVANAFFLGASSGIVPYRLFCLRRNRRSGRFHCAQI